MPPQRGLMSGAMSAPRIQTSETLGCQSGARELNHSATGPAPQMSNFKLHQTELEKEEQTKPKVNRKMENRAEINKIETKKPLEKVNETKNFFFEKISKIDKRLARLSKKKWLK